MDGSNGEDPSSSLSVRMYDPIRIRVFVAVIVLLLLVLGGRLAQLQLIDSSLYAGESRSNAVREVRITPARGNMYDRQGRLMVDSEPTYQITVTPYYFDASTISLLSSLMDVPDSVIVQRVDEARTWSMFRPSVLFPNVGFREFAQLQENHFRLPGIGYDVVQKRRYLSDARAAHAVGFVREITRSELDQDAFAQYRPGDVVGKAGVEKRYEEVLRGEMGRQFKLVNIVGVEVKSYANGAEDLDPISGYNVHLTLDASLQAFAESLFVNKRGAVVALDPRNGEILAMVSNPDFEPSLFSDRMDVETWQALTGPDRGNVLFNRATMSGMPPGSTWKPFMTLMALQEGIITPDTKINCQGGVWVGNRFFRCHGGVHGPITLHEAIQKSCNSFYYSLMLNTDLDQFKSWASRFGFGTRIPMDISEQAMGLIPDSSYYDRAYPRGWTTGSTVILGIGQGDMVITPMQLARYVAALANGGTLYAPHLVRKMVHPETGDIQVPSLGDPERLPIDSLYLSVVRRAMASTFAPEEGPIRGLAVPGVMGAGKTGTAQNPHGSDHSWFIYFGPFEDPEIAIAVLVENGGFGATQAAPIGTLLAERYLNGRVNRSRQWLVDRMLVMHSDYEPVAVSN